MTGRWQTETSEWDLGTGTKNQTIFFCFDMLDESVKTHIEEKKTEAIPPILDLCRTTAPLASSANQHCFPVGVACRLVINGKMLVA